MPLLPFFALGLSLGLLTAWLEQHHVRAEGEERAFTLMQRFLIAGRALWFYAGKLFSPSRLTFIYPHCEVSANLTWQWLFPVSFAAVVGVLWAMRKRIGRGPLAAVLFFVVTLAPALGFVNVFPFRYSFVADHFQYLAGIGLIVLAAVGLSRLTKTIQMLLVLLFPILVILTWQQTKIYSDQETLWRDTLAKNPAAWIGHNNLGVVLLDRERPMLVPSPHKCFPIYPALHLSLCARPYRNPPPTPRPSTTAPATASSNYT